MENKTEHMAVELAHYSVVYFDCVTQSKHFEHGKTIKIQME